MDQKGGWQGLGGREKGEFVFYGDRVSDLQDEKVLEMDSVLVV